MKRLAGLIQQGHSIQDGDHRGDGKVHITPILRKIRARNRTQAAIWAVTNLSDALDMPESRSPLLSMATAPTAHERVHAVR